MTNTETVDLYYDPFDFEIDDDPYPVWRRMRYGRAAKAHTASVRGWARLPIRTR